MKTLSVRAEVRYVGRVSLKVSDEMAVELKEMLDSGDRTSFDYAITHLVEDVVRDQNQLDAEVDLEDPQFKD